MIVFHSFQNLSNIEFRNSSFRKFFYNFNLIIGRYWIFLEFIFCKACRVYISLLAPDIHTRNRYKLCSDCLSNKWLKFLPSMVKQNERIIFNHIRNWCNKSECCRLINLFWCWWNYWRNFGWISSRFYWNECVRVFCYVDHSNSYGKLDFSLFSTDRNYFKNTTTQW